MESIHKRIRRLREEAKLTQEQLAKEAGVKYQSVQEWERENGTAPSRKRQPRVAKALGVSPHELMTGETPTQTPSFAVEGPEVTRVIMAFGWLTDAQKRELLRDLEAKAATNKTIAKELGPRFEYKTDAEMLAHLQRSGDFPPGLSKKKKKRLTEKPKRDPGTAMDDFTGQ